MNSLNNIKGPSTHQNRLDHDFDPLAAKPKSKTDWVASNTPKNYLPRPGEDMIGFHLDQIDQILKRAVKAVGHKVSKLFTGVNKNELTPPKIHSLTPSKMQPLAPRPYAPANWRRSPKPQATTLAPIIVPVQPESIAILVDLSPDSKYGSTYSNSTTKLSRRGKKTRRKREFKKMLNELTNLEKHLQKQEWYKDLMDVFPPKGATNAKQEDREEQEPQKLENLLKNSEKLKQENLERINNVNNVRREQAL